MTWNETAASDGFSRSALCGAQPRGRPRGYFRFRPAVLPPARSYWLAAADSMTVLAS